MFPRYAEPIRTVAGQWRSGCSASATTAEKQNRCRFWGAGFFTFYQAIERLRRKLRPSAGLISAEVLHFRIGDSRRACSRLWPITTGIARHLFGRFRSKSRHGANTANRSLVTHSRHRAPVPLSICSRAMISRRVTCCCRHADSIARRIRIVAAGWSSVCSGSGCSCRCAIICVSMDFPVNASNAPRRQRPSYSGRRPGPSDCLVYCKSMG
jgi:hypothetical protein